MKNLNRFSQLVFIGILLITVNSCSKDEPAPEVKHPDILGNIYAGYVDYKIFSLAGNSSNNKAFKFISSSNVILIRYVDNTNMPGYLNLPIYELTSKIDLIYTLNFPYFTIGTDLTDKFNSEADFIFDEQAAMNKVDNNSDLGIFLNSVK